MSFLLRLLFVVAAAVPLQFLQCPSSTPQVIEARSPRNTQEMKKRFDSYAHQRCLHGSDNWWALKKEEHEIIASDMFDIVAPRPGDLVFDWGSGCGTKLRHMRRHFPGTVGFGIDISEPSVVYSTQIARENNLTDLTYCHANGVNLSWIPDASVNHVISFGALHYLGEAHDELGSQLLCQVVGHLLRITKPGGILFLGGHLNTPNRQYYYACIHQQRRVLGPIEMKIVTEWDLHKKHKVKVKVGKQVITDRVGRLYWGPRNIRGHKPNSYYTVILKRGTEQIDLGTTSRAHTSAEDAPPTAQG